MKILIEKPPIWDEAVKIFDIKGKPVVFAWGDILYNPTDAIVPPELWAHEMTHGVQQKKFGSIRTRPSDWPKKFRPTGISIVSSASSIRTGMNSFSASKISQATSRVLSTESEGRHPSTESLLKIVLK